MISENEFFFDKTVLPQALEENDPTLLLSFYQLFLDHTLPSWHKAELDAREHRWEDVRLVAHSLKSSSRGVGALQLGNQMAMIEKMIEGNLQTPEIIKEATDIIARTTIEISAHILALQADAADSQSQS
ncbi:hypothetical protein E3V39_14580 [Gammaproteobacteria bacterium LSUCC0112]|nr:hypothetical protein E3V39_14580 [Gammaproteobacteria bacterium LSUCC0112]